MSPESLWDRYAEVFLLWILFCLSLMGDVQAGSVAVFGRGEGKHGEVSERWGVLSPGTQIFLLVLGVILALFALYGLYRLYRWCKTDPRKAGR